MNLNIIGNGFDLYHGLPSSYFYFGSYLIENNLSLYDELSDMYGFKKGIYYGFPGDDFYYAVEGFFWKDFETHLGEINESWVDETLQDDLGLEYDDPPVDLEMYQYDNAKEIKKALSEWIKNVVDKKENYNIIRAKIKKYKFKVPLRKNDIYLSFNYTHTLEEIYGIDQDQILHIHGEALEYTENTLVIGHGNDIRIQEIKKDLEEYEKDYFDQASCNRENELKCILHNLRELRKDVNLYINNCDTFLDKKIKHKCIDTIKIYGLSMGEVDLPYLINIRNKFPNAKWSFSYYSQNDFYNIKEIAKKYLSLEDGQYERFEFYNRYSHDIESEIVALHKIKQFKKI